tara:strand:+ start:143 stop:529 length:387 start_codon:yes stop_codon:yes gene_type:complete
MSIKLNTIVNCVRGGRGTTKPKTYGGVYSWKKESKVSGLTNRDQLFMLGVLFFQTKNIYVWDKATPKQADELAKLFSTWQGNSHYSGGAVKQQIAYAKQAFEGKVSGSIDTTLEAHASGVRLNLYYEK